MSLDAFCYHAEQVRSVSANYHKPNPALEKAKQMPPLEHWPQSGYGFDIMQSGVVDWLCQQRELLARRYSILLRTAVLSPTTWNRVAGGAWRGMVQPTRCSNARDRALLHQGASRVQDGCIKTITRGSWLPRPSLDCDCNKATGRGGGVGRGLGVNLGVAVGVGVPQGCNS